MKPQTIALLWFFWIILAADCYFIVHGSENYRVYTKTLLVPVLIGALLVQTNATSHKRSKLYFVLALFFSFAGDAFLIGDDKFTYFLIGLIFFLVAHIFYISFFFRIRPLEVKNVWFLSFSGAVIIAYIIILLSVIWANMEADFAVAVTFYALCIGGMMFAAVNTGTGRRMKKVAYYYFIPGALLFVISDSLLALNKFNGGFINADILTMVTYGTAQFLLTIGGIKVIKNK